MAIPSVHTEITPERWRVLDDGARFSLTEHPAREPRVFTTFLAIPGEDFSYSIAFLPEHLHRLSTSAAGAGVLEPGQLSPAAMWRSALQGSLENYRRKQTGIAVVRLLAGDRLELFVEPYLPPWAGPVNVVSIEARRARPHWKLTDSEVSIRARRYAVEAGAHEALLFGPDRQLTEGAWSNIFWFDGKGVLHTTFRDLLPGIVRQALLRSVGCRLVQSTIDQFKADAVEAFITKSTSGISPVRTVDGIPLRDCGVRTAALEEHYRKLMSQNMTNFDEGPI